MAVLLFISGFLHLNHNIKEALYLLLLLQEHHNLNLQRILALLKSFPDSKNYRKVERLWMFRGTLHLSLQLRTNRVLFLRNRITKSTPGTSMILEQLERQRKKRKMRKKLQNKLPIRRKFILDSQVIYIMNRWRYPNTLLVERQRVSRQGLFCLSQL